MAHIESSPSPYGEGVASGGLPQIVQVETLRSRFEQGYTTHRHVMRVEHDSGYGLPYRIKALEPDKSIIDKAVVRTLPWKTQNSGPTGYEGHQLAQDGIPTILVGAEGSHYDPTIPLWARKRHSEEVTCQNMGRNVLALADKAAEMHGWNTEQFLGTGASRGAILQVMMAAEAPAAGKEVIYAELSALEGIEPEKMLSRLRLARFFAECAAGAVAETLKSIATREENFWDYTRYMATHPAPKPPGFDHYADAMLRPFLSGEVGEAIREQVPNDYHAHSEVYRAEVKKTLKAQQQAFKAHPNVEIDIQPGNHAACMGLPAINRRVARLTSVAVQLQEGRSTEEINWQAVHNARP